MPPLERFGPIWKSCSENSRAIMTDNIKPLHEQLIEKSNQLYDKRGQKYPFTSKAVCWDNPQTQYFRFHEIARHLSMDEDRSVLDVGCGNAEFYQFLNFSGFKGQYRGYDINQELLSQARKRYPGIVVEQVDILTQEVDEQFDYVVVSGLFNLNFGQTEAWVEQMLTELFKLCRKKLIFNAISTHVNFQQEEMFYLDPARILQFVLQNLSSQCVLEHGALPYNYVVAISKGNNWQSIPVESRP